MSLQPIDPECRKFLKCLKSLQIRNKRESVGMDEITELMNISERSVIRIADFLDEMNIIVIDRYDSGGYAGFHVTQLGRHYNKYRWYDFKQTLLFSIILPLFISAISGALTALLTLFLQGS